MQRHAYPRCRSAAARAGCALLVTVSASAVVGAAAAPAAATVPAELPPRARTHRVVYTCIEPGLVTFADKPCGPWPQARDITIEHARAVTAPAARHDQPAAKTAAGEPSARTDPRHDDATEGVAEAQARTCERLLRSLRDLDARMRAGYSAREAGRLWGRWREARERVREAGC